jgi:AcrR family transcriptional regulator
MGAERRGYDDRLDHIMRAAAAVFAEQGYERATVRAISRATGVSLAGLYHYFRSKEELLFLIQDHCFATVTEDAGRRLADVADPERRLRLLVDNHLRFFADNMKEMKVLSHEAETLTGEFRRRVNARKREYVELCIGILRELRPAATEAQLRAAAFSLFGMMNWIYNWYQPGRDLALAELADEMSRLFLRGYLAGGTAGVGTEDIAQGEAPSIWRR